MELLEYLNCAVKDSASDLFIVAGGPISYKVEGRIRPLSMEKVFPETTEALIRGIYELAGRDITRYLSTGDDDFSFAQPGLARFRVNTYRQRGSMRGCRARTTKSKDRVARYETLRDQSGPESDGAVQLSAASSRLGRKTVELKDVSKAFDGRTVLSHFSYGVLRSDRIGIVGHNGVGKSTLLRIVAGELAPDSGTVEVGATVKIGHFSQEGRELDLNQRVGDFIRGIAEEIRTDEGTFTASQMMERFLFTGDLQAQTIGRLSGGERRRLYLLSVLMEAPNLLLLDEPTNDLDVTTLAILEDYLQSFPGPILAVSHGMNLPAPWARLKEQEKTETIRPPRIEIQRTADV